MLIVATLAALLLGGQKPPSPALPLTPQPVPPTASSIPSDTLIYAPVWARGPRIGYPEAAAMNGVGSGWADIRCVALDSGQLTNCMLLQETPAGQGFGQEALNALSQAWVVPGLGGRTVQQRVRFQLAN